MNFHTVSVGAAALYALALAQPVDAADRNAMTNSFFEPFDRIDLRKWYVSDGWVNGDHQGCTWLKDHVGLSKGILKLKLSDARNKHRPYGCAEIRTHARYGYGLYEARMRMAPGLGTNSGMFTYIGPPVHKKHDEIDFEFLGKTRDKIQLNWFESGRGNHEFLAPIGRDATQTFNDYAFEWTPGEIRWFINGKLVHRAKADRLPEVPGQLFLTLWAGSDRINDWLGRFTYPGKPIYAEVDWVAYTRPGERCLFPQSISCKPMPE